LTSDNKPGRLGIITALPAEANCFSNRSFPAREIVIIDESLIIVSGIGSENAVSSAQKLIDHGATALVSWGTAGGLSDNLRSGDLLLPKSVQLDKQQYQTDHIWLQRLMDQISSNLKLHDELLIQSNDVIFNSNQKSQLQKKTSAIAVDMESGSIAKIADQHNLPFLIIRSVVDTSDETIPVSAINSIDEFGQTKPVALMANLIRNPGDISRLIKLGKHFQQARKSLKQVTTLAGISLAASASSEI